MKKQNVILAGGAILLVTSLTACEAFQGLVGDASPGTHYDYLQAGSNPDGTPINPNQAPVSRKETTATSLADPSYTTVSTPKTASQKSSVPVVAPAIPGMGPTVGQ